MANRAEWARRVADWKASGLTAAEFAEPRGWAPATLRWWASRLNRPWPSDTPIRFARLVPSAPPPVERPSIVIEIHRARLVLPSGFDRDDLASVLQLLDVAGSRR